MDGWMDGCTIGRPQGIQGERIRAKFQSTHERAVWMHKGMEVGSLVGNLVHACDSRTKYKDRVK